MVLKTINASVAAMPTSAYLHIFRIMHAGMSACIAANAS